MNKLCIFYGCPGANWGITKAPHCGFQFFKAYFNIVSDSSFPNELHSLDEMRLRRECYERFPHHCGLAIPTCVTARAVMHGGIANNRFSFKLVVGKTFPAFLVHAQPANLRIW